MEVVSRDDFDHFGDHIRRKYQSHIRLFELRHADL